MQTNASTSGTARTTPGAFLDAAVLSDGDAWQPRLETLAWIFVGLGVMLRLGRYLLKFPLWGDELFLAQNFLQRDYGDMFEPLTMAQIAPLPYLWIELTSIKLFGFSEWSLRLWSVLTGVSSVLLFHHLARRLLSPIAMVLAVGVFAVSYHPIRHAAECKPYASDLCASLVLIVLAVRAWQQPENRRWLWALVVVGPLMVALSYPTVFVAGGVCLALAWSAFERRDWRAFTPLAIYNLAFVATFGLLLQLVSSGQYKSCSDFMIDYWKGGFPPANPFHLAKWLFIQHSSEMMAYPMGDDHGGSIVSFFFFAIGVGAVIRRRQFTLSTMVLAPLGLALLAAALRRYPYGGARLAQWYASLACLMVGYGAACGISWLTRPEARRRFYAAGVILLLVVGGGSMAKDLVSPYKRVVDFEHRGFVRWFWSWNESEADVVCVRNDLGKDFFHGFVGEDYSCYQRIYSASHRNGPRPINVGNPSRQRPLRCVLYWDQGVTRDEATFNAWLAEMTARYDLMGENTYRVKLNGPREPARVGCYQVYEFRPKPQLSAAATVTSTTDRR
ncbi:MAG TPA: glycosyltransferase family 39 protein [Pirellulales bacterium]|jgi:hypothetical protein